MTARELIKALQELEEEVMDNECLLGINQSCGFADYDHIEVYPIEDVYSRPIEGSTPLKGYWYGPDDENKILLYVFP